MLRRHYATKAYDAALAFLKTDLKAAMRSKDTLARDTVKSLLAAVRNKELEPGLTEAQHTEFLLYDLFAKASKQRRDSAQEYAKLDRAELQQKELQEAAIIDKYVDELPVAPESEVKARVEQFVAALEGENNNKKNVGAVLKQVDWDQVRDEWRADEKLVKRLIAQAVKAK
jgi:uncharacterized protein YqeY